jgi:hypothetical protein
LIDQVATLGDDAIATAARGFQPAQRLLNIARYRR